MSRISNTVSTDFAAQNWAEKALTVIAFVSLAVFGPWWLADQTHKHTYCDYGTDHQTTCPNAE